MAAPMAGQTLLSHNIKPSLWCDYLPAPPISPSPSLYSMFPCEHDFGYDSICSGRFSLPVF